MSDKDSLKKTISGKVISDLIHNKRLTQAQVAKDLDESEQVISNYAKGKRFISAEFASKWERKYGEKLIDMIDQVLNKSTIDDINITSVEEPSDNKQNGMSQRETFYQDLMEKNEQYSVIPTAVLKDYKIVPDKIIDVIIRSNENERKALEKSMHLEIESLNEKNKIIIEGYKNGIKILEAENERLKTENAELRRQIPPNH